MNVIFLGPPGAGKGTVASCIKETFGLDHLSTGDMLRSEIRGGTELGLMAKKYIDAGNLVPDSVIIDMVDKRLKNESGGVLFDGFPRTVEQAGALDDIAKIDAVINLDVKLDVIIGRICSRRVCGSCSSVYNTHTHEGDKCDACGADLITRADDNEQTVTQRFHVYEKNTAPLIEYYTKKGLLTSINADDSVENICKEISAVLEGVM